jgi:ADP-ribosyl-[dinitrogen reductase] hydrolase
VFVIKLERLTVNAIDSNKLIDALLGVCIGDALGVPVEFSSREKRILKPVKTMQGQGTYNQPAGTWSDDSTLTFCLAEAIAKVGFEEEALIKETAANFCRWYDEDYWTPHGELFDIGGTTADAIENLKTGISPTEAGGKEFYSNGNGSLMRILPLAFGYRSMEFGQLIDLTHKISCLTHAHPRSQITCGIYIAIAVNLLQGKTPLDAYLNAIDFAIATYTERPHVLELIFFQRLFERQIHLLPSTEIRSSAYTIDTLEASIWCLYNSSSYAEAVLMAVNLGGDTDTTAAVTGGLAGIYFGLKDIPPEWLDILARRDDIIALAERMAAID